MNQPFSINHLRKLVVTLGLLTGGMSWVSCKPPAGSAGIASGAQAQALLGPARQRLFQDVQRKSTQHVDLVVDTRTRAVLYLGMSYPVGATPGSPGFQEKATATLNTLLPLLDGELSTNEMVPSVAPGCDSSVMTYNRTVQGLNVLGSTTTLHFSTSGNLTDVVNATASVSHKIKGPHSSPALQAQNKLVSQTNRTASLLLSNGGPDNDFSVLVPVLSNRHGRLQQATLEGYSDPSQSGGLGFGAKLVASNGETIGNLSFSHPGPTELQPIYHQLSENTVPDYISYRPVGGALVETLPGDANAAELVYRFLGEHPTLFHTGAPRCQFTSLGVEQATALNGVQFVRMEQRYLGLPVFGAQLVFEVHDLAKIMSAAGHILPSINLDIQPAVDPGSAASKAKAAVLDALRSAPNLPQGYLDSVSKSLAGFSPTTELGIFPGSLVPRRTLSDRLAYKVTLDPFVYFIDAISGVTLYGYPIRQNAFIINDASATSEASRGSFITVEVDSVPTGRLPLNTDITAGLPTFMSGVGGFYGALSWNGSDNHGGDWVANTNVAITAASGGCPNSFFDPDQNETFFCLGVAALPDVVGHEFTHGVVAHSSNLVEQDESGAMNEGYADLFGNLIFPDAVAPGAPSAWLVGEPATVGGVSIFGAGGIRDMANPVVATYGAYVARNSPGSGCTLLPTSCDDGFVHTNNGILNRAHVLLDGVPGGASAAPPFPGLANGAGCATPNDPNRAQCARNKLLQLAFLVMRFKLTPWSRMDDAAIATQEAANVLVLRGATDIPFPAFPPGSQPSADSYTQADADQVPLAFGAVGLSPVISRGWSESGLGFSGTDTFTPANTTGCAITNVIANLATPSGQLQADLSPAAGIPPAVSFPTALAPGAAGVYGIAFSPLPTPGTVPPPIGAVTGAYSIAWFDIFGLKPSFDSSLVLAPPPAGAINCITPPGFTPVTRFSAVTEHSAIGVGGKGTDTAGNATSTMNPACTVTSTLIQMVDSGGNLMEGPAPSVKHVYFNGLFFTISSGAVITGAIPTGPPNLSTTVSWWFDSGVAIRYQLVYFINQPNGITCTP